MVLRVVIHVGNEIWQLVRMKMDKKLEVYTFIYYMWNFVQEAGLYG